MSQRTFAYRGFDTGVVNIGTSAEQLPDVPCKEVVLKGVDAVVYGSDSTVTTATGFPLAVGELSPPIYVGNLNQIWAVATVAGDIAFQVHV